MKGGCSKEGLLPRVIASVVPYFAITFSKAQAINLLASVSTHSVPK